MTLAAWIRRIMPGEPSVPSLWQVPVRRARFAKPVVATKPRVRINAHGWIRHDGSQFPFAPRTPVEVIFLGDHGTENAASERIQYAEYWPESWWQNTAGDWRYNIRWYRIVSDPVPPIGPRS